MLLLLHSTNKIFNYQDYIIYHKMLKAIYYVLDIHNLPIHQPFLSKDTEYNKNAFYSIPDFLIWVQEVTEKTISLITNREPTSAIIDKLTMYIRNNLNNDLTRLELTKIVHLHPDYLSSLFRQKTGLSLLEFITKERMNASKKLLVTSDLPISEIAIRTGFQTVSYFSKQFKRYENITPNQYRKKNSK